MKLVRRTGKEQYIVDVELDEFELHNILCGMYQEMARSFGVDDEDSLGGFKIVPSDEKGRFTSDLVTKWEQKMNDLLRTFSKNDAEYHDDAEYTC